MDGIWPATLGLSVYVSLASPAQLALVDLGAILISDSVGIEMEASDQGMIEMKTAPAVGEQSPPADQSVRTPLFQSNKVAVKWTRYISWF